MRVLDELVGRLAAKVPLLITNNTTYIKMQYLMLIEGAVLQNNSGLELNFIPLSVSGDSFTSFVTNYESHETMEKLRLENPQCHIYREGNLLHCVPVESEVMAGQRQLLPAARSGRMVSRLIAESLFRRLSPKGREILGIIPTEYIDIDNDIITKLPQYSDKLRGLHIYPRIGLHVKSIKTANGKYVRGLVIDVSAFYDVSESLDTFSGYSIDLRGRYVIKRIKGVVGDKITLKRHLLGKVEAISNGIAKLSDFRETDAIPMIDCCPEARKENFNYLLQSLLGPNFPAAKQFIDKEVLSLMGGEGKYAITKSLAKELYELGIIKVADGILVSLAEDLLSESDVQHRLLEKPVFVYDQARRKTHTWHNGGLNNYGPFDSEVFSKKQPKIAVVVPDKYKGETEKFVNVFKNGASGKGYYQQGFARKYRLSKIESMDFVTITLGQDPSAAYREACLSALEDGKTYDLALVIIEEQFNQKHGDDDPYLVAKSTFMSQGVPVQEIEIETIRQGEWSWPYIVDNVALACYVKMGGIPWTLATYQPYYHELVIGMGNAILKKDRLGRSDRFVGITNVFSADGTYLLNNVSREISMDNYKEEMIKGLKACIDDVSKRNAWQQGDNVRLIFHQHFKEFRKEDIEAIRDFISGLKDYNIEYAFVHISDEHPFQVYDTNQPGVQHKFHKVRSNVGLTKGKFAPERGLAVRTGDKDMLLTLTGPDQVVTPFHGIPKPIWVSIHKESSFVDVDYIAKQVYDFTFLNWRGFNPTSMPVTILYSNLIAELLGKLKEVAKWNPDIIRTKLKYSRWFL